MAKPVIGRKLNALMGTRLKQGGSSPFSSPEPKSTGSGVHSLLTGQPAGVLPAHRRIPRWYLFGADLMLVAVALLVLYKNPAPLSGAEKLFGIVAVILGAGLALIATCMRDSKVS